jgi:hypothetical protein
MRGRKLVALVFSLPLLGCVPNATTYYRPSMAEGRILTRHCVPTESIVEFGSIPFQASVMEGSNGWFFTLWLPWKRPPDSTWRSFHFTASDFRLRDLGSGVTTSSLAVSVSRDDKLESIVEPYRPPRPKDWFYSIEVKFPGPTPEKLEILIPPLVIDGREVRFAPIRFERQLWMGISPFNC